MAHPNRFGGWVEGKTNGMNYYQAARGKDLCQDRARMKLALAATPCCITPHHIKSQILHCNVSHRFCTSRPSRAKLQTWDKVNRAASVTQGVWPAWKKHLSMLHPYYQPINHANMMQHLLCMYEDLAMQVHQGSSNMIGILRVKCRWHLFVSMRMGWCQRWWWCCSMMMAMMVVMMMMVWRGYGVECH